MVKKIRVITYEKDCAGRYGYIIRYNDCSSIWSTSGFDKLDEAITDAHRHHLDKEKDND